MVETGNAFLPPNTRVVSAIMSTPANAMYQVLLRQCEMGKASVDAAPGFCSVVSMEQSESIYVSVEI
jgi:hypothetical protein